MSYCRWSSDDFQCDIYCWADVSGDWVVTVAGRRHEWLVELPPEVPWEQSIREDEAKLQKWAEASANRHMQVSELMKEENEGKTWRWLNLDFGCEGGYYRLGTPGEAADKIEELRDLGYKAPQYAIDALREEQDEMTDDKETEK